MPQRLLVATRKGLFILDAADGWRARPPAFLGEPVSAVLHDPRDGTLYAALRLGHFGPKLHRSEDGGASWTELACPAFPPDPANPDAPAVDMVWTLVAAGPDRPGRILAGTLPAALFESDDRGATWRLNAALHAVPERKDWQGGGYDHAGLHTILLHPADSARITLAISTGGVWRSDDGGATWRLTGKGLRADYMPPERTFDLVMQDVHRLAASPAAPDIVWCQHHCGIFRSDDGGETFSPVAAAPSGFGFGVAAHPTDGETAWFAPAVKDELRVPVEGRLVVTRTGPGGVAPAGEGLPAAGCYDLIYRHALAVDATGDRLAIGSTTGNLWLGEGGGAQWRALSANLPPIAAVAFA
jgi:hypothetical protein